MAISTLLEGDASSPIWKESIWLPGRVVENRWFVADSVSANSHGGSGPDATVADSDWSVMVTAIIVKAIFICTSCRITFYQTKMILK